jgi:hypothetical protein
VDHRHPRHLKTLLWPRAPRKLNAIFYVLMGTITFPCAPALRHAVPDFHLLALGGLFYILGACVYALRWPNPAPHMFGYHEIFHLFVFAAAAAHYLAVLVDRHLTRRRARSTGVDDDADSPPRGPQFARSLFIDLVDMLGEPPRGCSLTDLDARRARPTRPRRAPAPAAAGSRRGAACRAAETG